MCGLRRGDELRVGVLYGGDFPVFVVLWIYGVGWGWNSVVDFFDVGLGGVLVNS